MRESNPQITALQAAPLATSVTAHEMVVCPVIEPGSGGFQSPALPFELTDHGRAGWNRTSGLLDPNEADFHFPTARGTTLHEGSLDHWLSPPPTSITLDFCMVGIRGIEPHPPASKAAMLNHHTLSRRPLCYPLHHCDPFESPPGVEPGPWGVEHVGIEPTTFCMPCRRSTN